MRPQTLTIAMAVLMSTSGLHANGNGTSTGLTLLESPGARPPALGEAFTSVSDDITALGYNPASLGTLTSGQASFLYNKGIAQDSSGHLAIGVPTHLGGLGLSVGYYNGGDFQLFD